MSIHNRARLGLGKTMIRLPRISMQIQMFLLVWNGVTLSGVKDGVEAHAIKEFMEKRVFTQPSYA